MEFYPITSKITPDLIVRSIKTTWLTFEKEKIDEHSVHPIYTNATELTYYLFDNIFRGVYYDRECMKVLYNTLIELNSEIENMRMVKHLEKKKEEYLMQDIPNDDM